MKTGLVVKSPAAESTRVLARLPSAQVPARDWALMSNAGRTVDFARVGQEVVHLFAVGQARFDDIVVAQELPMLYANDFTLAWLRALLARVGEGALWVQYGAPARAAQHRLLSHAALVEGLPGTRVEQVDAQLSRVLPPPAADTPLRSILPRALAGYHDFCALYADLCQREPRHWLKPGLAESQFIYAMMGANQKSWLAEGVALRMARSGPLDIADIGGGFGHFAAEMACKGHAVTVYEIDPAKCAGLGPWLATQCGVGGRLRFVEGPMEDIAIAPDSVDLVTVFGSLLYADRARVRDILAMAWRALRAGGALVVHENPRDAVQPGAADYEFRFPAAELRDHLAAAAAQPRFLSPFNGLEVAFEKAAASVMVAVAVK